MYIIFIFIINSQKMIDCSIPNDFDKMKEEIPHYSINQLISLFNQLFKDYILFIVDDYIEKSNNVLKHYTLSKKEENEVKNKIKYFENIKKSLNENDFLQEKQNMEVLFIFLFYVFL